MYQTMKRILLLALVTFLKIAIILANSMHSSFVRICEVIAGVFQLQEEHSLIDLFPTEDRTLTIPHDISSKHSISTQTEGDQHEKAVKKSGTDVIIYNLNSTQKLVISQGTFKRKCENCKSETEISLKKDEDVTAPTICTEGTNISDMSIESDVLDSKIESSCSSSSNSSGGKTSLNSVSDDHLVDTSNSNNAILNADNESHIEESENSNGFDNASFNACNDRFSLSVDLEHLNENNPNHTYVRCSGTTLQIQNTSSPLRTLFQSPQNLCTNLSRFNTNQESQTTETTKIEDADVNSDFWEDNDLDRAFKRRLSLPAKLNTTKTSTIKFKQAQQKLIEEALKSTPRHEKSLKEIKYPFSSEISLDSKPNDGIEDKEVFSCSSYESLPVSDHLRNAFEKNTFLSLYNENLHSEDKPDFSCVDDLIEAFNNIKTDPLLENLTCSKTIPSTLPKTEITDEKDFEFLNTDENQQHSSFNGSSSDKRKLKEYPKLSDDYKESSLDTGLSERMITNFTSEVNSSTNMRDVCKVLDRFVDCEIKLVSETFSRFCNEELSRNDNENYVDNFEIEQSDISELDLSPSPVKENKPMENSKLALNGEENNTDENKLNHMKYVSSGSPINFMPLDLFEKCAIGSDVQGDFENNESSIKDSREKLDYIPQALHQLYTRTVFIDKSPSREKSPINQYILETNSLDRSLNEDDKPTQCEKNISSYFERGASEFDGYVDSFPSSNQSPEILEESVKNEKSFQMKCITSISSNKSMLADQFEWTGDLKNPVIGVKDRAEIPELRNAFQVLHKAFLDQSSLCEKSPANQYILEANCQNNSLKEYGKPAMFRKRTRRNPRSKIHARDSTLTTNRSTRDNLTVEQQSFVEILSDKSSHPEEYKACQEISEINYQDIPSLNEGRKPMMDENTSSGESASDNSVETVKDLNVMESKIEENKLSEKSD